MTMVEYYKLKSVITSIEYSLQFLAMDIFGLTYCLCPSKIVVLHIQEKLVYVLNGLHNSSYNPSISIEVMF